MLIIDVDLGFANIDILFGHTPRETIIGMLDKQLAIEDVIEHGPLGLQLIAGGQGFSGLFELDSEKMKRFMEQLGSLQGKVDFVLLDTGAGLSENNMRFLLAADEVLLVTTPEPTSVTDAYSVVKMMHAKDPDLAIRLVVNQCTDGKEGRQTAENFAEVAGRFWIKTSGRWAFCHRISMCRKPLKSNSHSCFRIQMEQQAKRCARSQRCIWSCRRRSRSGFVDSS